ncbi:hypothetical protein B1R94_03250 [Mycolicibacterium litorale]|nr:hypothetical protein B1R94_03250 [Mycolicibacterium litorale]
MNLAGRVVAITGGARGIGAATAAAFAEAGATVAIGDVDVSLAERTASRLGCWWAGLDVTHRAGFADFLDSAIGALGRLDVLVNNAGIMPVTALVDESAESVQRQLAINVAGVVYGTQLAIERMAPGGAGSVVNVASAAGRIGFGGVATYTATKFAVAGFTEAAALEYRSSGIRFTTVFPGMVNTELAAGLSDHAMMRSCSADVVAAGIVDAVRRGRRAVYVPRRLGVISTVYGLLPSPARTSLMSLLGADHQMLQADDSTRAAYERRVQHRR